LGLVAILVIIVVAVVAYIMVNRAATAPKKRSLDSRAVETLDMNTPRSVAFTGKRPSLREFSASKIVVPNGVFNPAVLPREAPKGVSVARRYVVVDDLSDPDP